MHGTVNIKDMSALHFLLYGKHYIFFYFEYFYLIMNKKCFSTLYLPVPYFLTDRHSSIRRIMTYALVSYKWF
jgi:hypothetical protein